MVVPRFQLDQTALLVVDVQEKLQPHMHDAETLLCQVARLIDVVNVLELPVLVTEQYRKGLGSTVRQLGERLDQAVCTHEKLKFSACIDPVRKQLQGRSIRSVLVCGIEAHVCVLQTCLDLAESGFVTGVVTDAIGSRHPADREVAVQRMSQAGVVPTTVESVALELLCEAGGDRFKAILEIIK
jgi:nicotinamidase-related amidase